MAFILILKDVKRFGGFVECNDDVLSFKWSIDWSTDLTQSYSLHSCRRTALLSHVKMYVDFTAYLNIHWNDYAEDDGDYDDDIKPDDDEKVNEMTIVLMMFEGDDDCD